MLEEFDNYYGKFEKASIARRIAASFVDFIIFYLVGVVLGLFFDTTSDSVFSYNLEGVGAIISFCFMLFLWPISEGLWGQTLGKRFLDLKVVNKKNQSINIGQAFGRFFLGYIDCILLIGIIVALINKDNQRIGDAAAGTIVVKSKFNG